MTQQPVLFLLDTEEIVSVKTVEYPRQNCALPDAVLNTEEIRKRTVPSDIYELVHVDEEQESEKDNLESCRDELLKEEAVLH